MTHFVLSLVEWVNTTFIDSNINVWCSLGY